MDIISECEIPKREIASSHPPTHPPTDGRPCQNERLSQFK